MRMFALVIGIDTYASNKIPSLTSAVADAQAIQAYLHNQLNVSQTHITTLENKSASRAGIIDGLQRLANDTRIQRGDPILIFYAGHGSQAPVPIGWEAGGSHAKIQVILSSDALCESGEGEIAPIPDRTFGALLEAIAKEKGNNIFVVMDSCHSASGTRSITPSESEHVRFIALPPGYRFPDSQDHNLWSSFPTNAGLQSHVLLAACGSDNSAWESRRGGDFTAALLKLLKNSQVDKLRYRDIVRQMDINPRQNPHCEGLNQERYIFTLSSPSPVESFFPARTRIEGKGLVYVLNGGAAHGLVVGDEFAVYSELNPSELEGTLIVDELGPFYSIVRLVDKSIDISANSIAIRIKEGRRQPLRIRCFPKDKILEALSMFHDNDREILSFDVVDASEAAQIDIRVDEDQVILWLKNVIATKQRFFIESNAVELAQILKAASYFFSQLDRTSKFPAITDHVQLEISELHSSRLRFRDAPTTEVLPLETIPVQGEAVTLRQEIRYGLKLTNNSEYDLYPIVQFFDPSANFIFNTWYQPACSRIRLDVPLKKEGGSLTIGYGSGGSPPLVIPSSHREGLGFLKISLFSRPVDPFYNADSFRMARFLPDELKGPWATIVMPVYHQPSVRQDPPPLDAQSLLEYQTYQPDIATIEPTQPHGHNKSAAFAGAKQGKKSGWFTKIWGHSKAVNSHGVA